MAKSAGHFTVSSRACNTCYHEDVPSESEPCRHCGGFKSWRSKDREPSELREGGGEKPGGALYEGQGRVRVICRDCGAEWKDGHEFAVELREGEAPESIVKQVPVRSAACANCAYGWADEEPEEPTPEPVKCATCGKPLSDDSLLFIIDGSKNFYCIDRACWENSPDWADVMNPAPEPIEPGSVWVDAAGHIWGVMGIGSESGLICIWRVRDNHTAEQDPLVFRASYTRVPELSYHRRCGHRDHE